MNFDTYQLKPLMIPIKQEKRNNSDEFDKYMTILNNIMLSHESNGINPMDLEWKRTINQFNVIMTRLVNNEYFHLIYINNFVIKSTHSI